MLSVVLIYLILYSSVIVVVVVIFSYHYLRFHCSLFSSISIVHCFLFSPVLCRIESRGFTTFSLPCGNLFLFLLEAARSPPLWLAWFDVRQIPFWIAAPFKGRGFERPCRWWGSLATTVLQPWGQECPPGSGTIRLLTARGTELPSRKCSISITIHAIQWCAIQ